MRAMVPLLDIQVALVLERQSRPAPRLRSKAIQLTILPAVEAMASLLKPAGARQTDHKSG